MRSHPESGEIVYGRRPVWEVLQAGKRTIRKLWILDGAQGPEIKEFVHRARERHVEVVWVDRRQLDRLTPANHQGVVAQVAPAAQMDLEDFLDSLDPTSPSLIVLMDEIQDPQNVGAILRAAGFFGVGAAILPKWRSAPAGETAFRTSAGAAEHVPVIRVTNLVQTIDRLKEADFEVVGTEAEGEPVWSYQRTSRCALVLGNEGKGLRRLVREHCDKLLGVPVRGQVGSLNVGSAAAVFLYEFSRPRVGSQPT